MSFREAIEFITSSASEIGRSVDAIFWALTAICGFMVLLLGVLILYFCVRYRRGSQANRTLSGVSQTPIEIAWVAIPLLIFLLGVFITGFSSIATGLNFIVTIHKMRAPGLTWFRLPLFVWTLYTTSLILVLATPVLAITLFLMALERMFGVGIFDPALGGDPVLFQHLFWFYSHPAVYIMILPGMGVISEIIACFARKRIFGYRFVAYASIAIAVLGFLVWGHHMFVSGQSVYADEFQLLNVFSSAGASILAVGYILPLAYMLWSLRYGKPAPPNPWPATGLEWTTPSPPPTDNFAVIPTVSEPPYAYETLDEASREYV